MQKIESLDSFSLFPQIVSSLKTGRTLIWVSGLCGTSVRPGSRWLDVRCVGSSMVQGSLMSIVSKMHINMLRCNKLKCYRNVLSIPWSRKVEHIVYKFARH